MRRSKPPPLEPDSMSQQWYHEGLRFECTRCGHCCTGAPGVVWVDENEVAALARHLGETVVRTTALHTRIVDGRRSLRERANGDCIFFDKAQGCTIYPVRPTQCRTWPFWESNLTTPEEWQRTCEHCPGSGQGTLFTEEEITVRLKQIRI